MIIAGLSSDRVISRKILKFCLPNRTLPVSNLEAQFYQVVNDKFIKEQELSIWYSQPIAPAFK